MTKVWKSPEHGRRPISLSLLGCGLVQEQCDGILREWEHRIIGQGCGPLEALTGKDFPAGTKHSSRLEFQASGEPM